MSHGPYRVRAFTLVELLVVIGIIAILIAILLPVIKKVRQSSERIACASNMRQLGIAFLAYANDNKGSFPAPARAGWPTPPDWLYWQKDRKLSDSRLWVYLGKTDKALTCPSGVQSVNAYLYSYAINTWLSGSDWSGDRDSPMTDTAFPPCKTNQVTHSSERIMVVEPTSTTIFDGLWYVPRERQGPGPLYLFVTDRLSIRHSGLPDIQEHGFAIEGQRPSDDAPVQAICVDGHHVYMPRRIALRGDPIYPALRGGRDRVLSWGTLRESR